MEYTVSLTDEESALLNSIELDQAMLTPEKWSKQAPLVVRLMESLVRRKVIPEIRMRYWNDPDYKIGRPKISHKGLFERYNDGDSEIYQHANFLSYLRFFLFGAQLPKQAIDDFEEVVGKPEWVSSGDITEITKGTRSIVRKYNLRDEDEEFYRLALDYGLSLFFAKAVKEAVKEVR